MPRVWNRKFTYPMTAKYVGRPTLLGNPYSHLQNSLAEFKVANVQEAIAKFEAHARELIKKDPKFRAAVMALKDQDVVCWCAPDGGVTIDDPLVCHGQILVKLCIELHGGQHGVDMDSSIGLGPDQATPVNPRRPNQD